jgi:NAD(P)-dependent dehydrogenase (short-subunit alcohol dehydrogenase family)
MDISDQLTPRVCLLTGSAGILGSALMRTLLPRYRVIAIYRNRSPFSSMRREIEFDPITMAQPYPYQHVPFSLYGDITREADLARIVDAIHWHFGIVDLLVNAAVLYEFGSCLDQAFLAGAERQFETNVFAPTRLAAKILKAFWQDNPEENRHRRRNLVNVSSTSGVHPVYGRGQALYGAAKAALNHISCHMADEYSRYGVRVNCVCPTSFPGNVAAETVANSILRLDSSDDNGVVISIE